MPIRKTTSSKTGAKPAEFTPGLKRTKKVCLFCEGKKEPTYTDSQTLKKFMSDRSRIIPRAKSGVCSKHQRRVSREIKHARHLALLPFVASI